MASGSTKIHVDQLDRENNKEERGIDREKRRHAESIYWELERRRSSAREMEHVPPCTYDDTDHELLSASDPKPLLVAPPSSPALTSHRTLTFPDAHFQLFLRSEGLFRRCFCFLIYCKFVCSFVTLRKVQLHSSEETSCTLTTYLLTELLLKCLFYPYTVRPCLFQAKKTHFQKK